MGTKVGKKIIKDQKVFYYFLRAKKESSVNICFENGKNYFLARIKTTLNSNAPFPPLYFFNPDVVMS